MPFCSFSKDAAMFDATPIENMFLLEYLPIVPDGFLRVYLYARMLCLHPEMGGEIGDMARALHMEEDTVFNAFSYWEQQGLAERLTDQPPTYALLPLREGGAMPMSDMDRDYYQYRDYNAAMQAMFGGEHLLHPKQYKMANDWLNVLGFTQDAALRILEAELAKSKSKNPDSVFKRADKTAVEWAERGLHTLEDVERAIAYDGRVSALANRVLQQFSMRRQPTVNELDCVRRWIDEWKLSDEDVLSACAQTTKSRAPSIAYLDAILKNRADKSNLHFDDVKAVLRELGAENAAPTPDQIKSYEAMLARGFEPETVCLAAIQCARKKKHRFEDLDWMLDKFAEADAYTQSRAKQYIEDMTRAAADARKLLETAGLSRRPNMDDLKRCGEWRKKYSEALIFCAAELARGKTTPMVYMAKLLSEWEKNGVTTPEAARAQHAKGKPAAQNYQQHSYTESDFGTDFYFDPSRDYAKGSDEQ